MRHLTLPTLIGACSLDGNRVSKIEPISDEYCRVHLKAIASDQVKKGTHNQVDVKLSATELRSAIAEMADGDVYDPWNLGMTGELE